MSDPKIYLEFTKAREGGVSKAKTDSASKFPVPDGTGNHTIGGITWKTFFDLGPELGYIPTPSLFYSITTTRTDIYDKIYNHFWETAGASKITSQAIAQLVFQSLWGGGHEELVEDMQRYFKDRLQVTGKLDEKTAAVINLYTGNKANELAYCQYVFDKRLTYLRGLKAYKANGAGWENRYKKLQAFNNQLITGK